MIKCNELMIGDWVRFAYKYGYGTGQVVGIEPREGSAEPTTFTIWKKDKEGNTKFFVGVSKNCVRPIPLTVEILEKNGFETEDAKDGGFVICDDYYDIFIYEWSDSIWVARYESTEMNIPFEQATISYVHELQHFLKSNVVEKEIEL